MLRPFLLSGWISLVLIVALLGCRIRCNGVTFSDRLTAAAGGRRRAWLARGPRTRAAGTDRLFGGLGLGRGDGHGRIVITGVQGVGQAGLLDRRFGNLGGRGWLVGLFGAGLTGRALLRIAARLLITRLLVTGAIATTRLLASLRVITLAFALVVTLIVTLAGLVLTIVMVTILTVVLAVPVMVIAVLAVPISVVGIAAIIVLTMVMWVLALAFGHLALRFTQHAGIVFGMLQEALFGDTVMGQLGVPRKRQIFFNDLLRGATHLALGPRAVEDTVDHIAKRALAIRFTTRTGF